MTQPRPPDDAGPPAADALESLGADDWAVVLTHLRPALHDLEDAEVTPAIQRLRAAPASRLAGGRTRSEVSALLARGGQLWRILRVRLASDPDLPDSLSWLVEGVAPPSGPASPATTPPGDHQQAAVRAQDEATRQRERAARLQRERDEARRRLDGAQARAAAAEEAAAAREEELAALREQLASARAELTAAAEAREAVVERERRRAATERADLEHRLREARRALDEVRAAARPRPATQPPTPAEGRAGRREPDRAGGLRPGRPSQLPPGVRRGTREAVDALLHRGRVVLVDGYNVTKTQRPDLSLEQQRRWLIGALRTLASRTGVHPTVVWDSTVAGPAGRDERARSVSVRFTAAGTSADDELHFAVEAMDADTPVVVVTDDRELRRRLDPYRVDLLGTGELRWVLDG